MFRSHQSNSVVQSVCPDALERPPVMVGCPFDCKQPFRRHKTTPPPQQNITTTGCSSVAGVIPALSMSASAALSGIKITLAVTAAFFPVGFSTSSVPSSLSKTPSITGPLGPRDVVLVEESSENESSISVPGACRSAAASIEFPGAGDLHPVASGGPCRTPSA